MSHFLQLANFFEIQHCDASKLGILHRTRASVYQFIDNKLELKQGTLYYLYFMESTKDLNVSDHNNTTLALKICKNIDSDMCYRKTLKTTQTR